MSDRRADARDRRLSDVDSSGGAERDESKKVGRTTLDEIDWDSATERRDVLAEWMEHGTTPLPKSKRGRTRRRRHDGVTAWTDDYPEFPTHIGDWRFGHDETDNGFLKIGYVDGSQAVFSTFSNRKPRVVIDDLREFDKPISAYVITNNVFKTPAGSPPGGPIVTAEDPETFRERLVIYLDGEQPDEIRHPYYDPALERNLPAHWEYVGMLPTQTKAKHKWVWRPPNPNTNDNPGWRVFADGYVNGAYDVYAYTPGSSVGYRAPRYRADEWRVDVMPGDGAAVATETARRIMQAIIEDPTEPPNRLTKTSNRGTDSLRFSFPDQPDRQYSVGARLIVEFYNSAKGEPDRVEGELIETEFYDRPREEPYTEFTIEADDGEQFVFRKSEVYVDGRKRGHTRSKGHGVPRAP